MYFSKTGSFRPNQSRLDRFQSVNRFIRWTDPVTGSGFKNIGPWLAATSCVSCLGLFSVDHLMFYLHFTYAHVIANL